MLLLLTNLTGEGMQLSFSLLRRLDPVLLFSSHLSGTLAAINNPPPAPGVSLLVSGRITSSGLHL